MTLDHEETCVNYKIAYLYLTYFGGRSVKREVSIEGVPIVDRLDNFRADNTSACLADIWVNRDRSLGSASSVCLRYASFPR
jgi:hypothetical protein